MFDQEEFIAKLKETPDRWVIHRGSQALRTHQEEMCPITVLYVQAYPHPTPYPSYMTGLYNGQWAENAKALNIPIDDAAIIVMAADNTCHTNATKEDMEKVCALRQRLLEVLHPEEI